jgi:hypothetical protein
LTVQIRPQNGKSGEFSEQHLRLYITAADAAHVGSCGFFIVHPPFRVGQASAIRQNYIHLFKFLNFAV